MMNPHNRFCSKINEDNLIDSTFRDLTVYVCSWNVNSVKPKFDLSNLIKFEINNQPDICVFGFQEVNSNPLQRLLDYFFNDPWTNELTNLLSKHDYVNVSSVRLVGILLNVFVKRSILSYIRYSINGWIRLGFCGLWGNKGASICTLNIGGSNVCFINSHLSAHQHRDEARKKEYSKIVDGYLKFANATSYDYLFFFGDLNFRIENSIENVKELISKKDYKRLFEYDQLNRIIKRNEQTFKDFKEMTISFPPTYKFDLNTNNYDTSAKKRIPSWCDRILFKSYNESEANSCNGIEYNHINSFNQSDHKPIYGLFKFKATDWIIQCDDVVFGDIYSNEDQNLDIVYFINENVATHYKDWIGIYKSDFKGNQDYVTYVWSERIYELENKNLIKSKKDYKHKGSTKSYERKVTVQQSCLTNGVFLAGYFSFIANQLIGISTSFELRIE